ncbi:MAG: UDP-2,4-diacetamido-2,4,6-trideoxy-beta-L-altropyranose hydrolase [Chitinophagaceae bacterium]|nr:UDP-2,4-diacetamido-2,4,6-trideoxy-beta-L-altropyranose hydrolase [Chitinophagaceae bacterium]
MNFVFRVDSSVKMGIGHLMRCLTLANTIREVIDYSNIIFISRRHPGNINNLILKSNYSLIELPFTKVNLKLSDAKIDGDIYEDWLGTTSVQDASETIESVKDIAIDWLIIDSYGIDIVWEKCVYHFAKRLMVIDDLANRSHYCDLLLDQNYAPNYLSRYEGLLVSNCRSLLGPDYALLKKEFIKFKHQKKKGNTTPRLFLFLSGSEETNSICYQVVKALFVAFKDKIEIDVVIGKGDSYRSDIQKLVAKFKKGALYSSLPDLGYLMSQADIAIGGGGTSTWERMFMGLPSIVISLADNQLAACRQLNEDGYIYYIGHCNFFNKQKMIQIIERLNNSPAEREIISLKCQNLVDGQGSSKVVHAMLNNPV